MYCYKEICVFLNYTFVSQVPGKVRSAPESVCIIMITGKLRGQIRVAMRDVREIRTRDNTAMHPGSILQEQYTWWKRAAGSMTSTAMTGEILLKRMTFCCKPLFCTFLKTISSFLCVRVRADKSVWPQRKALRCFSAAAREITAMKDSHTCQKSLRLQVKHYTTLG